MKPVFNRRKATSFGLLFSFLIMLASGIILWIFPQLVGFSSIPELGGLTRPAWLKQHIVFGILFALLSLYHLFGVNRELFFSYLKKSASTEGTRRTELLTTLLATALIAAVTALHIPAFSGSLKTASTFERNGDDREAAYERSAEYTKHTHHHHDHAEYGNEDGGSFSPQLADSRDEAMNDEARFTQEYRNDSQAMNNGAPDDELHRRTTASCASCH